MKKFYIVHGWEGSPNEKQLIWLRDKLVESGYEAVNLEMPNTEEPEIKAWINKISESIEAPGEDIFLIGHSIGGQAVLRFTETLPENIKIGGLVLIAPWMKLDEATLEEEGEEVRGIAKPWMETPIDFKKIKEISPINLAFFSDNDPYVDMDAKEIFEKEIGAKTFVIKGRGHFIESNGIELPEILEEINNTLNPNH